jgi:sugar (pentulose or hexulose) kinase
LSGAAFVFDLDGLPRGSHATAYKTDFPKPSWAEQDPEDWWQALGASVKGALGKANVAAQDVFALCVDTTCCSVVTLERDGRPLRPAMIWVDVRSARQADAIAATKDPALRVNGAGSGPVSAEWLIPKSLWIKEKQRELFDRAEKIGEYQDCINLRLTGRWVGSLNNMSVR